MGTAEHHLLLVDDDESLRRVTRYHLEQAGYSVQAVGSGEEALETIEAGLPDLVITDVKMPGMSGLELLARIKRRWPELGVVVITAHGSIEAAVRAMRAGAHDYLPKPFEHEALLITVEKGLHFDSLLRENRRLRELNRETLQFENLVTASASMKSVLEQAARVAPRDTTVLILGESGTGKELLARAIYNASSRRDDAFVAVNVGALSSGLIESELFGHVKGAFTGAIGDHPGCFERADGGTLFLDEIGDLRPELQGKLLRVLQEGEVQKVGSSVTQRVNVRLIAATNRDLESMVEADEFREDLFYRLFVIPLHLPPLRDRRDDIPLLVRHFARKYATEPGSPPVITDEALRTLHGYAWPGNVRELENVIQRACVLHPTGPIAPEDLPDRVRERPNSDPPFLGELPDEGLDLEQLEKEVIRRALYKCGGNQSRTARFLGITRNTLLYRLEKHGIRYDPERPAGGGSA